VSKPLELIKRLALRLVIAEGGEFIVAEDGE